MSTQRGLSLGYAHQPGVTVWGGGFLWGGDNLQGGYLRHSDCPFMVKCLERCITGVSAWCASKRLQLNGDKTELLWFGSMTHLCQVSLTRSITVNNNVIQPATVICDLGVWIDSELSMCDHVSRVAQDMLLSPKSPAISTSSDQP